MNKNINICENDTISQCWRGEDTSWISAPAAGKRGGGVCEGFSVNEKPSARNKATG